MPEPVEITVAKAKLTLAWRRARYERALTLRGEQAISDEDFETAKYLWEMAELDYTAAINEGAAS